MSAANVPAAAALERHLYTLAEARIILAREKMARGSLDTRPSLDAHRIAAMAAEEALGRLVVEHPLIQRIATAAAEEALRRFAAMHPVASCVAASEAAEILGVSVRTISRMKLPRNRAGKIPYEAVRAALTPPS